MKRIINLTLAIALCLTGCSKKEKSDKTDETPKETPVTVEEEDDEIIEEFNPETAFTGLNDANLRNYYEDLLYTDLVAQLPEGYVIDTVQSTYISKEYIEELQYNSKVNVFFGYTLDELEAQFQGTKYIFTLDENGNTVVQEVQYYQDDYMKTVLTNMAIGGGVILFCVTISVVTGGAGAPAASMIFAASAKTAGAMALSSGTFGALSSGFITYATTGDVDEAFKASLVGGSEAFKWGAIFGAVTGGGSTALALHSGTTSGLTMNEVALIQKESGFPLDVISQIHSMEEYKVFQEAGLHAELINDQIALIPSNLDLTTVVDDMGRTNLDRMLQGLAPLDEHGISFELHHIGQNENATLAMLTQSQHDNPVLHGFKKISEVDHVKFNTIKKRFYKALALMLSGGA